MSSWKKAAKSNQKTHRERQQLVSRKELGFLEKHKDYVYRAQDYHKKERTLKKLKRRALNRNPDEFYFHMINSKVEKGVHKERKSKQKNSEDSEEQMKLLETRDSKYITYRRTIESRKVEKLQSSLHMIDAANQAENKHTFFVEGAEEMKNFDLAERLDTHPALISRKSNRPRLSALKSSTLLAPSKELLAAAEQEKMKSYRELKSRINRENELNIVQRKLEIRKALKNKKLSKPKKVKQGGPDSAPIYKWKFERQK